jgi:UDP-N-acetyl-D-galactosamine dehydrogenase
VGGHCIGVDPYYLTCKAQELGYHPQVILAGRSVNDSMGRFIAQRMIKLLIQQDAHPIREARVGILGLTFKENVPDLRNSRVADIISELREFGIEPMVHDPMADRQEACHEYGVQMCQFDQLSSLDGVIYAVGHKEYRELGEEALFALVKPNGAFVDVKSLVNKAGIPEGIAYWRL